MFPYKTSERKVYRSLMILSHQMVKKKKHTSSMKWHGKW